MNAMNIELLLDFDRDSIEDLSISLELDEESPNTIIIKPVGYINIYTNSYFEKQIENLIDLGFINLIFDMSKIEYVSAVGIGSLIYAVNRVNEYNGEVFLSNIPMHVIEVFKLPGFAKYFSLNIVNTFTLKSRKDTYFVKI